MSIGIKCLTCTKYQEPSKFGRCELGELAALNNNLFSQLIVQYLRRELGEQATPSNFDFSVILWNCSNYKNAIELWKEEEKQEKDLKNKAKEFTEDEKMLLRKLGLI